MRPMLFALALIALVGCREHAAGPAHRERFSARDSGCLDPARPHAFMYPAANRTDYGPDVPSKDGCELAVPDHLFCCPNVPRVTDR